jgi:E3 ubiquitin-protein ligase DOA10
MMDMTVESVEAPYCRFCHEGDSPGKPLYYPCKCSGSIKFIHQECLQAWLRYSRRNKCDICGEKYRFEAVASADFNRMGYWPMVSYDAIRRALTYGCHGLSVGALVLYWSIGLLVLIGWSCNVFWNLARVGRISWKSSSTALHFWLDGFLLIVVFSIAGAVVFAICAVLAMVRN